MSEMPEKLVELVSDERKVPLVSLFISLVLFWVMHMWVSYPDGGTSRNITVHLVDTYDINCYMIITKYATL
jgi:hypothetical protein